MNINRDYLIINDVKKSNVKLDNGSIFFYITDKNTQNIFVNLVINVSNNDLIQKYANIENAEDYTLTMNIVKPDNTYKIIEGKLHDKEKAIFEFNLNEDCCDEIGTYRCELLTKCTIDDHEEITTSNKLTYKVKASVLNDLDNIVEAPEYPLVIQLFDKLSDIEQYEEDRRAAELARQLAEEQRQTRFEALDADVTDSIQAIGDKVVEVENRIATKEAEVDTLIVDAKADIDNYKVAKDQEIDEYKALKDTEINEAIANQNTTINAQNDKISAVENNVVTQNNKLDTLENKVTTHEARITAVEAKDTEQDSRLDIAENRLANIGNDITNTMQPIIDGHTSRLEAIEAIGVSQNARLDAIEAKNQQQDDRLLDIEKVNKKQDMDIKCLFNFHTVDITEEGNSVYLPNSTEGYCEIDNIQGNTLVNCNKEPDKELILNGNINTSGDNAVTLTEGVDGGLVDVALEGNTLVNVSKTKDSTAISMSYTVENSGNHIALQGDVDGSCRPVITGNTLWIDNATGEILTAFDETKNLCLQSTFEDNLVTQEMVDSREEVADNLDKYRVDYKVNNNCFSSDYELIDYYIDASGNRQPITDGIPKYKTTIKVNPNTTYKSIASISDNSAHARYCEYTSDGTFVVRKLHSASKGDFTFTTSSTTAYIDVYYEAELYNNIVLACGGTYKEYTKTLYLNSPLLEGDTIEEKDNGIYHVHRSELVAYTEGDETSLITDKVNTLHQLASPQYELIEQSNLAIPSYANGHLDLTSAVPVEKVEFKPFSEELTYLYANTKYTVQFISTRAILADYYLGGTLLLSQNIVKGLNRISITTPSELVDNKLTINGNDTGANIMEVIVTNIDRELEYFEGMKSVGEGKELQVISINSDRRLVNTQRLTHEPLRGTKDAKDRYVLIDGKWYIERKCATFTLDSKQSYRLSTGGWENKINVCTFEGYKPTSNALLNSTIKIYADTIPGLHFHEQWEEGSTEGKEGISTHETGGFVLSIKRSKLKTQDINGLDEYLRENPIKVVYLLETPVYEPIEYSPFEVYSGTTNITTNSVIPTNITVKNHGYNCLLKPSTTYTISSNLGLNTVTTPPELTEDCLRFMDTDTSDVTTMKNVLVLEGNWTTKADLIPANFSGIESAFEQEYDAEKGKYKVNIKVANEDKSQENNIAFYINEPLRGVGDVKDRVFIKDDKVVVQRNCGIRAYEDGDFGTYPTDKINTVYPLAEPVYEEVEYNDTKLFIESFKNSTLSYNSNVPVTSKLYYSYSVPIVDTVAQTANVTDQQDSMIIDLATQVAVMEMMLM